MINKLLIVFLLLKLFYFLQSVLSPYPEFNRMNLDYPGNYFLQVYSNNDSGFYEKIAENGYSKTTDINIDGADYAFFPVYPFTGMLISKAFNISPRLSLLIVTTIASLLMLIVFFSFVKEYLKDENKAFWCSLTLIFFPHHFYFSMIYTESFFLLSALLCYYSMLMKNNTIFIISSTILVLTRINGIFYLFPLLIFYNRDGIKNYLVISRYYIFIPMILSILSYLTYLKIKFGSFLAFKIASEKNWMGSPKNPIITLYETLLSTGNQEFLIYNAIYSIGFLILSVIFITKRQYSFFLLSILSILIPLYEGSSISQPRFISLIFPFSIIIGSFIYSFKYRKTLMIGLLLLHLITFAFWNTTHPLSY